jgi:4-hydroxy-tetrahydrodipicolinate synthase
MTNLSKASGSICGVLPVFQTPYHDDESIDFAMLAVEIDWLFARGADGVVMAMVSEVLRLSSDERRELAARACRAAAGRGPVIISVGAESSRVAEEYARHAESIGATALMAIPPVSIAIDEEELLRYYRRIFAATGLPLVVQDAAGYVGRPISIAAQARLAAEFGSRAFFKPEAEPLIPRLKELRAATGGTARVLEGSGGIHLPESFACGIVGTMPGADLIDAMVALWRALVEGDRATVERISGPVAALQRLAPGLDGFLAIEKHLLVRQGILRNCLVRGPVGLTLNEGIRNEVDRLFDQLASILA